MQHHQPIHQNCIKMYFKKQQSKKVVGSKMISAGDALTNPMD